MVVGLLAVRGYAQDERAQLEQVRAAIEAVEQRIVQQQADMDSGIQQLRAVELEIGATQARLTDRRAEQATRQRELDERNAEAETMAARLGSERAELGRQVLLRYMLGREELLKLVLNQESPTTLGRMIVYYDYLNRARTTRIERVRGELEVLAGLVATARDAAGRLQRATATVERELASLEAARERRRGLVTSLQTELASSGRELDALRADEARLSELVRDLDDVLSVFPAGAAASFATQKGSLRWPVDGTLLDDYGEPRGGGSLRWNGVVLDAERGTPVRAVYYGRVAFSDWLPGLGLLLILDHGDRYLSLYGYNEVLLKEPGEWVEPGEVLARVGDSSGRAGAALYFELRFRGEPIDPHPWMRER